MKKTILILLTVGLVAAGVQSVKADDHDCSVAAKVLTGIAAASVVAHAFVAPPTYYAYSAPTVVYSAPVAPVYVAPAAPLCAPAAVYVVRPAPVVVYRPPVYRAVAPVVSLNFRFGGYPHYYHHDRW